MIALLLAAMQAAAAAPAIAMPEAVHDPNACAALVDKHPEGAIGAAKRWAEGDGGLPAQACLGEAYAAAGQFAPSATVFESAAHTAELDGDGAGAASLFTQGGDAALAGGDAGRARTLFDRALARPELKAELRGEVFVDRARADVQAGDPEAGRTDLNKALTLVPADPMAWLLSATLARRQGDAPRASKDIAEAKRLAPHEAAVAYEEGNIAQLQGNAALAREAWGRAVAADASSDAGQAAALALSGASASAPPPAPASPGR